MIRVSRVSRVSRIVTVVRVVRLIRMNRVLRPVYFRVSSLSRIGAGNMCAQGRKMTDWSAGREIRGP